MYTKVQFAKELKEKISKNQPIAEIGVWCHSIYLKYIEEIEDPDFDVLLLTLNTMELGPEYEFTYEELNNIAENLIAGNDVKLEI